MARLDIPWKYEEFMLNPNLASSIFIMLYHVECKYAGLQR